MNILVAENRNNCLKSIIVDLRSKFPNPSIITVNSDNYYEVLKILETKPILTKGWLVMLHPKLSVQQMAHIMDMGNLNVIHISNPHKAKELHESLVENGVECRYFDNTQATKEDLVAYVESNLNITYEDAVYLVNRHIGNRDKANVSKVIHSVTILSTLDKVTKKEIQNYTTRFNSVGVPQLVERILGLPNPRNTKQLVEVIYKYKYGFGHLLKYIKKEINLYISLFDLIRTGDLDLTNYQTFEFTDKELKRLAPYKIKKIIESYSYLSYDKLYLIKLKIDSIQNKRSSIYELIMMIGG